MRDNPLYAEEYTLQSVAFASPDTPVNDGIEVFMVAEIVTAIATKIDAVTITKIIDVAKYGTFR